ncbi:hypothetical protein [Winogradskyella sp.]|uniref:hypothetical protein n=1 Tax=Winogradskyella sp. TaxID=1883156 RepID=UPI003F6C6AED
MGNYKNLKIFDFLRKRNVKRFSIFFALAFLFLIFSKLTNDYKQIIKLKIILSDLPDEIVLENDSLNSLNAYVEAKGFALLPFIFKNSEDILLDANTDVLQQSNYYMFDVQKNFYIIEDQLGESYEVISLKPDTLKLTYSKMTSKYVHVQLKSNINFAPGFDIKNGIQFNIDSIKVVGAKAVLDSINVLSTEVLELKEVNTDIEEVLKIDLSKIDGVDVFPSKINISAKVSRFTEGTIELPITVINKPTDVLINYFPKKVTVSYYVDLDSYNSISPADFIIECDYSQASDSQSYLIPKISNKPDNIKRINIQQNRIDFIKL